MKKAIIITAIVALTVGAGGGMWLKTYLDNQNAARVTQEQEQKQPERELSRYEVGPIDPDELLELVNEERRRVGIPPLQYDYNVHMSAQLKSNDMLARDYKQHNLPGTNYTLTQEMHEWVSKSCVSSGENFYWAGFAATSRDAFNWWMNSKLHREAIQDAKYTKTGFGVSIGGESNGFAVQHFCVEK